jgi:hypothetical protein
MQGSGVTVVKEAGQFFPFGILALHGRFEQRFLNIARHVTPNIHSRSSQQVCVFEQLFGRTVGAVFGLTFTTGSLLLLYGLGIALRRPSRRKKMPDQTATPLKIKIEQMLTEARVIIPEVRR